MGEMRGEIWARYGRDEGRDEAEMCARCEAEVTWNVPGIPLEEHSNGIILKGLPSRTSCHIKWARYGRDMGEMWPRCEAATVALPVIQIKTGPRGKISYAVRSLQLEALKGFPFSRCRLPSCASARPNIGQSTS